MKINPNGFREYDARWIFEKEVDIEGINNLGKGLGTQVIKHTKNCLLYTSPSPRDDELSRMPSSA